MFARIIKPKNRKSSKVETSDSVGGTDGNRNLGRSSSSTFNRSNLANSHIQGTGNVMSRLQSKSLSGDANGLIPSTIELLPTFRDVHSSERQNLFLKKLKLCKVVYDFSEPTKNVKEKEIKRQTLSELVDYIAAGNGKFTEAVTEECFEMISANLFRALPAVGRENGTSEGVDGEEEESSLEPAWSHLQLVYEILMRYVSSPETDAKVAKKCIDGSFVLSLLDLFDSEDPRERESLKTILHRIYGKFMVHRPFIRKSINNIFYRFIFETEKHNGIAELLEILGSIINGFALPLKDEHKQFLVRALIPLHKPKNAAMYHQQLSYCVTQFVEKDSKLADIVISGLLKYWPVTNSQKEVLFLSELEEVLESTQQSEFQRCMIPLFRQIGKCLNSMHFQVAERALFLWNNDHIVSLVAENRLVILPLIFDALERNTSHWNLTVSGLTSNVRKMFFDLDLELFKECQKKYQESGERAKAIEEARDRAWKELELAASKSGITKAVTS